MTVSTDELLGWFAGRVAEDWFTGALEIQIDRDEILVVGTLKDVEPEKRATKAARLAAQASRIEAFRDETRGVRMRIAKDAQHRFGKTVSWGVRIGDTEQCFTTLSVPVMTRLRLDERQTLDTLVAAGVARSRSEALAWCVKLVGEHTSEWIEGLREALTEVDKRRAKGPKINRHPAQPVPDARRIGRDAAGSRL